MDTSRLQGVRPCGRHETYSTARHHLGFYNNVGLTATYTTTSTLTRSLEALVFAALHHVVAKHPILSAIPIKEEISHPDVYFARLPDIDLRTCVEFLNRETPIPQGDGPDSELDELLRKQHNRNFKGDVHSRPYWRLVVGSSSEAPARFTASWIFHHALSDGASSMLFHESFLEGLNAASVQTDVNPMVKSPMIHPSPSLEELHPMTISWTFFLRAIAGAVLPSYSAPRPPNLWTGDSILQTPGLSHNTTVVLSAETTLSFAKICRKEKTSVTAALSTLLAATLSRDLDPQNELRIDTPISVRPFLSVPDENMVNAITNHTFTFNCTDSNNHKTVKGFSWDTARAVKEDLIREVEKKGADNPIALLKYVSNMHDFFLEKLGTPRDSSAEVSNIGVWRPRDSGAIDRSKVKWSLGRMTFSQSLNHTGPQISLSVVTGGDGCLVMGFNWPEDVVQSDREGAENSLHMVPSLMKRRINALLEEEVTEQ